MSLRSDGAHRLGVWNGHDKENECVTDMNPFQVCCLGEKGGSRKAEAAAVLVRNIEKQWRKESNVCSLQRIAARRRQRS